MDWLDREHRHFSPEDSFCRGEAQSFVVLY